MSEKTFELNPDSLVQSDGRSGDHLHAIASRSLSEIESDILDLGCGRGEFLERLAREGRTRLAGCDGFAYTELSSGAAFHLVDLNKTLPFPDHSFRAVTAIEVIEHLENPRQLWREIARVLKPGGRAVVSTPNNESLTSLISLALRGQFSAFVDACYPAHITPVLRVDMLRMARECGLNDLQVVWSDWGRLPGSSQHWQAVTGGLVRGRLFSDNYFVVARKSA